MSSRLDARPVSRTPRPGQSGRAGRRPSSAAIRSVVVGVAGLAIFGLAGCSPATPEQPAAGPSPAAGSTAGKSGQDQPGKGKSSKPAKKSKGAAEAERAAAAVPRNDVPKFRQVTQGPCTGDAHRQLARGTVKNSGSSDASYSIVVNFVNPGSTVLGTATTKVSDVAPGQTKNWTASKKFTTQEGMRCVVVSVR